MISGKGMRTFFFMRVKLLWKYLKRANDARIAYTGAQDKQTKKKKKEDTGETTTTTINENERQN